MKTKVVSSKVGSSILLTRIYGTFLGLLSGQGLGPFSRHSDNWLCN